MLTAQDIKKLSDYLLVVFKDVFVTKEDIGELKASFDMLQSSMDNIAKESLAKDQEATITAYRMKRAEGWIDQAAPKVGVPFEY